MPDNQTAEQVRATFDVEGHRIQHLTGRWAEATFEIGEHSYRLHTNPDGSGFMAHLLNGKQLGLVAWEPGVTLPDT